MLRQSFSRLEWDAQEYEHKERSQDWFWAVGIISFSIAVAATIFGNIIFGILVLVSVFALVLFINREPESVHVVVNEKGITKDRVYYPYSTLESFWIDHEHPHNKVILKSEKFFMPLIVIPLDPEINPDGLAEVLNRYISEKYHPLPFVEQLLEYLGF
jgi:hypothetical protein